MKTYTLTEEQLGTLEKISDTMGDSVGVWPREVTRELRRIIDEARSHAAPVQWVVDVKAFRDAYGIPTPAKNGHEVRTQARCVFEEVEELDDALCAGGYGATADTADAIIDSLYTLIGLGLGLGIDLEGAFAEVQRSNMTKLGADGKPIYRKDGKVLKGPNFTPPDLNPFLPHGAGELTA